MSSPDEDKPPFWPPPPGWKPRARIDETDEPLQLESPEAAAVVGAGAAEPEARAKFCPECGTPTNGLKFCGECGASTVIGAAPASSVQAAAAAEMRTEEPEREVWRGTPDPLTSPVEAKTTTYTLTTERLRVDSGVVGKRHSQLELFRVKDVHVRRTLKHRARGRGDLFVYSTDPSSRLLKLEAIENPEAVAETLRGLVKVARQRMGITTREFM